MATEFIITDHPAVRDLLAPQVEHLQALLLSRVIVHVLRDMTCLTPLLVPGPPLGEVEPEVEQGMVTARHVPHVHPHLLVD